MGFFKNNLQFIKQYTSLLLGFFLKSGLSFKALSYIVILSYGVSYFIILPLVNFFDNAFLQSALSFLVIIFYIRHIYLFYKCYPPKKEIVSHERSFVDRVFLKNPRPIHRGDFIKIIIAINLFIVTIFFDYFL